MAVAVCCAAMGYFSIFTNLQHQDDEGQLLLTVHNFLTGHAMYGPGGSIYGPYFYFYEWAAHRLAASPVTTVSARLVSLAFWVIASLLAALLTYRASGSAYVAVGCQFLAFRALAFIPAFPVHPQELCVTLLLGMGLAAYARHPTVRMVSMGALVGIAVATKINTGAFMGLALAAAAIWAARPAWLRRLAWLSMGSAAFPVLLLWGHHTEAWDQRFALVAAVSLVSAILAVSRLKMEQELEVRHFLMAGAAMAAAVALGACFSLLHGGSVAGLLDWIVFAPGRSFGRTWIYPAHVRRETVVMALAGLALAWYTIRGRASDQLVAFLKLAFAGGVLFLSVIDGIHYDRTSHLMVWERSGGYGLASFFAAPLLWLAAAPRGEADGGPRDGFGRAWLAISAVLYLLYTYPVAAPPQVRIPAVPITVAAGVCLADGLRWLSARGERSRLPALSQGIAAGVALAAAWFSFSMARQAYGRYQSLVPLEVAGLERIHVTTDVNNAMHRLVEAVSEQRCTRLFTVPSMFSLNLWTGTQPLTEDGGNWVNASTDEQQERLIQSASLPQTCVIYSHWLLKEWQNPADPDKPPPGLDVYSRPLVRFLVQHYTPKFRVVVRPRSDFDMDYQFLEPNP